MPDGTSSSVTGQVKTIWDMNSFLEPDRREGNPETAHDSTLRRTCSRFAKGTASSRMSGWIISEVTALDRNLVRDIFGVVPNAPNEGRSPARLPREAEEIDAGFDRNAALMLGLPLLVK